MSAYKTGAKIAKRRVILILCSKHGIKIESFKNAAGENGRTESNNLPAVGNATRRVFFTEVD